MRNAASSLFLSLSAAVTAQVPPGEAICGQIGGSTTPLIIIDRSANVRPVTGFSALSDINALKLDPIDSTVWVGATNSGGIARLTIAGTTVVSQPIVASHGGGGGTSAITFDPDCNPIVTGGTLNTTRAAR